MDSLSFQSIAPVLIDRAVARADTQQIRTDRTILQELLLQLQPHFTPDVAISAIVLIERLNFDLWKKELDRLSYGRFYVKFPYLVLIALLIADKYWEVWDVHRYSRAFDFLNRTRLNGRDFVKLELAFACGLGWHVGISANEMMFMKDLVLLRHSMVNQSGPPPLASPGPALRDRSNLPEERTKLRRNSHSIMGRAER